jgi:hypothetical protein
MSALFPVAGAHARVELARARTLAGRRARVPERGRGRGLCVIRERVAQRLRTIFGAPAVFFEPLAVAAAGSSRAAQAAPAAADGGERARGRGEDGGR